MGPRIDETGAAAARDRGHPRRGRGVRQRRARLAADPPRGSARLASRRPRPSARSSTRSSTTTRGARRASSTRWPRPTTPRRCAPGRSGSPTRTARRARLLAARGHALDAAPRAMAMELADLGAEPPAPAGVEPRPDRPGWPGRAQRPRLRLRARRLPRRPRRRDGDPLARRLRRRASRSAASARSRSATTAASPASRRRPSSAAAGSPAGCCCARSPRRARRAC